jgi:hypothetical protein
MTFLIWTGKKLIAALWVLYAISATYVFFSIAYAVWKLIGWFQISKFFGFTPRVVSYMPFVWLSLVLVYLIAAPIVLLKLQRRRQTRN